MRDPRLAAYVVDVQPEELLEDKPIDINMKSVVRKRMKMSQSKWHSRITSHTISELSHIFVRTKNKLLKADGYLEKSVTVHQA